MGMRRESAHGLGAHTWRLLFSALAVALLVALGATPTSAATSATCVVTNSDTGRTFPRLQQAVDEAKPGAHLVVKGTCHGGTIIDKSLVIEGVETPTSGRPVLDGDRRTRVALVSEGVRVTMRDLFIQGGSARVRKWYGRERRCVGRDVSCGRIGGGISNQGMLTLRDVVVRHNHAGHAGGGVSNGGTLTLVGTTRIAHNTAHNLGGGVINSGTFIVNDTGRIAHNSTSRFEGGADPGGGGVLNTGTLTLNDKSRISGNVAYSSGWTPWGGGVANEGRVTLNDKSRISGNRVDEGGGVANWGILTLNDSSRISGNTAHSSGGGVFSWSGRVTLNDRSRIDGNRSGDGGGVYAYAGTITLNDSSRISGNRDGGGVRSSARLILNDTSRISGNSSRFWGGGVWNDQGTLALNDSSRISRNSTRGWGGGVNNDWGTTVLNDDSHISDNAALVGGGVFNLSGSLTLNDASRISDNSALGGRTPRVRDRPARSGVGGGVYNYSVIGFDDPQARVVLTGSSAITDNVAEAEGGGIALPGDSVASSVFVCAPSEGANVYGNTPDDCFLSP